MKLTVKVNLNVRVGKPSVNAPCYTYVTPGSTLEVDGALYPGDMYEGINSWYKDDAGNFYWSGGFEYINAQIQNDNEIKNANASDTGVPIYKFDPEKMSWAHDSVENGGLGIVDLWNKMGVRGEGVKVAVIDTGAIYDTNDLKGKINFDLSIDSFNENLNDTDDNYHGTKSVGIIGANGANVNTVFGVAPNSELIIYRLFSNENLSGYTDENFCYILQKARLDGVDIISMSFEMPKKPLGIEEEFQSCVNKNIILIASAGDENQNTGINNNYPASIPGCISVGAYKTVNHLKTVYDEFSCKSDYLFCLGPGENILTTGNSSSSSFHQYTSAAAPFVAGILSLIISYRRKKNLSEISIEDLKKYLINSCDKIDNNCLKDTNEGYGVINPIKLFNFLKQ